MRLPTRGSLVAIVTGLVVAVTLVVPATAAEAPGPAPVVTLLPVEGTVKVECGALPAGATSFQVVYQHFSRVTQRADTATGSTSLTLSLRLGSSYSIACRSRSGGSLGPTSAIATALYPDLTLPVMRIDTKDGAPVVSRDDYVGASVSVDPNRVSGVPALASSKAKIRGRGNSTWDAPTDKKPYKLKLDSAAPLLGLPTGTTWALLANYYDPTMLRTSLAFSWGTASSLAWTPHTAFVELILNGDYRGVYVLAETVDVGPTRVAIDPMSPTDVTAPAVTGGYLAEIDGKAGTPYGQPDDVVTFRAALSGTPFTIKDPDPQAPEQVSYLQEQVDAIETDILQSSYGDPAAYAKLGGELDLTSLADWYVISETSRNYDSWYSSTYLFKPRGGKLTLGPLWDFDQSMGTYFFGAQPSEDAWVRGRSPWVDYLLRTPAFFSLVQSRYAALRPTLRDFGRTLGATDRYVRAARANDAVRWGYAAPPGGPSSQVRDLTSWLTARLRWMDGTYGR